MKSAGHVGAVQNCRFFNPFSLEFLKCTLPSMYLVMSIAAIRVCYSKSVTYSQIMQILMRRLTWSYTVCMGICICTSLQG